MVSVGVLLAVVQLGSVPARRTQAGVLRQLGWRRGRIARWLLAEEAIALALAAIVGVIAVAIASVREVAAVSVAVSLLFVVVTSLVAVGLGARALPAPETGVGAGVAAKAEWPSLSAARACGVPRPSASGRPG